MELPPQLLEVALEASAAAADVLLPRFRRPASGVATKSTPTDLVSDADRHAEAAIREVLLRRRPGDAILGEEGGAAGGDGPLRWVVDPLDGTVNYLYGLSAWAVSIAVELDGVTVAGVVAQPLTGETFAAARGHGATLNGAPISVSGATDLATALVATGFAYAADVRASQAGVLAGLLPRVRDLRRSGSAALDLAAVAAGRIDAYYETGLGPWDVAAGCLLVSEAGGTVRDLPAASGVGVLAGAPRLVEALAAILI